MDHLSDIFPEGAFFEVVLPCGGGCLQYLFSVLWQRGSVTRLGGSSIDEADSEAS